MGGRWLHKREFPEAGIGLRAIGHDFATRLALSALAAGVLIFALLGHEIRESRTQAFDRQVLLAMRHAGSGAPLGPPALQQTARDISALGSTTVLVLLIAAVGGFLALDGKKRTALFVSGSVITGLVLSTFLKTFFDRPRPDLVPYGVYASGGSFPSGHSMMSAVTYLSLGALFAGFHWRKAIRAYSLLLALLLTTLVGVSRVYLGVHWPTDVLGGWDAGIVWASLCWLVAVQLQFRGVLEQE